MEKNIYTAKTFEIESKTIFSKIKIDLSLKIEKLQKNSSERKSLSQKSEKELKEMIAKNGKINENLKFAHTIFKRNGNLVNQADVDEIIEISKKPDFSAILALFVFGILFDILDHKKYLKYFDCIKIGREIKDENDCGSNIIQHDSIIGANNKGHKSSKGKKKNENEFCNHDKEYSVNKSEKEIKHVYNLFSNEECRIWMPLVISSLQDGAVTVQRIRNYPMERFTNTFLQNEKSREVISKNDESSHSSDDIKNKELKNDGKSDNKNKKNKKNRNDSDNKNDKSDKKNESHDSNNSNNTDESKIDHNFDADSDQMVVHSLLLWCRDKLFENLHQTLPQFITDCSTKITRIKKSNLLPGGDETEGENRYDNKYYGVDVTRDVKENNDENIDKKDGDGSESKEDKNEDENKSNLIILRKERSNSVMDKEENENENENEEKEKEEEEEFGKEVEVEVECESCDDDLSKYVLADEDWDSDAEGADQGSWVKGTESTR